MAVEIFFCYAREDEKFLNKLIKQLSPWQRLGLITMWHDQHINAGQDWEREICAHMDSAQVIMLLVSPDFISSDYCYSNEMGRAMDRYGRGEVCVIPVILRPISWQHTSFGRLQALPKYGKPVTKWRNQEEALYDVAMGLYTTLRSGCHGISEAPLLSASELAALAALAMPPAYYISRRTVLVGLGLALVAGSIGGGVVLLRNSHEQQMGTSTPTTQASAPATPVSTTQVPTSSQGKTLYTYRGHKDIVSSVSWSPSGTYIVSGSYDNTAHIWEATKGTALQTYRGHTNRINAVAWSPKETYIASVSSDKTAQVWNATTGGMIKTYKGHSDVVTAVAWSPDGTRIASGSYDGTVQIWDAMTGKHILTYPLNAPSPYRINAVAWSSDGMHIASGDVNDSLEIWIASTGSAVIFGGTFGPPALAWSPDGKQLAIGGENMQVEVDNDRRGFVTSYLDATSASTLTVAWSPNGKLIAFGGTDNTARVWNPTDTSLDKKAFIYKGHSGVVRGVTWSPDSVYVASGSEDKTVQVWQGS